MLVTDPQRCPSLDVTGCHFQNADVKPPDSPRNELTNVRGWFSFCTAKWNPFWPRMVNQMWKKDWSQNKCWAVTRHIRHPAGFSYTSQTKPWYKTADPRSMCHSTTSQLANNMLFLKYLLCYFQQFNCLYTCAVTLFPLQTVIHRLLCPWVEKLFNTTEPSSDKSVFWYGRRRAVLQ